MATENGGSCRRTGECEDTGRFRLHVLASEGGRTGVSDSTAS